ncbi:hypothetical protein JTB14_005446 [Gonioctena quinquepunctata]|nr:hypothetical protein JTB14_005446 [Gonioctena quinquepunctata]
MCRTEPENGSGKIKHTDRNSQHIERKGDTSSQNKSIHYGFSCSTKSDVALKDSTLMPGNISIGTVTNKVDKNINLGNTQPQKDDFEKLPSAVQTSI